MAFSCVIDFSPGKSTQVNFHDEASENSKKTLGGLKGRSVSPGKPTNEKPSFGHCTCSA